MITTAQEAYDQIVEYFSRPEARLGHEGGQGRYRTSDGRKCAVGCLIDDEHYDPEWDTGEYSGGVNSLLVTSRSMRAAFDLPLRRQDEDEKYKFANFLSDAQMKHDAARSVDSFLVTLKALAHEYGLQTA